MLTWAHVLVLLCCADEDADGAEEQDGALADALGDNEALFEDMLFRVEDVEDEEAEGFGDREEFEVDIEPELALARLEGAMVDGKVVTVEAFGIIVEFEANGSKVQVRHVIFCADTG